MSTLTKIIRGVFIYWLCFVATSWVAFFVVGSVPDTLVQYGLGGGAVELLAGAFIEVAKKAINKKYGGENGEHDSNHPAADDGAVDPDQPGDPGSQGPLG